MISSAMFGNGAWMEVIVRTTIPILKSTLKELVGLLFVEVVRAIQQKTAEYLIAMTVNLTFVVLILVFVWHMMNNDSIWLEIFCILCGISKRLEGFISDGIETVEVSGSEVA